MTDPHMREAAGDECGQFWLEISRPGYCPMRKGPWPHHQTAAILREFMAAWPTAYITVVTVAYGVPDFQDGPETLQAADGRSIPTGRKHIKRTRAAEALPVLLAKALGETLNERNAALADLERSRSDLRAALCEISTQARARGEAEGRLRVSEMAGIVAGWQECATTAEAGIRALEAENNTLRASMANGPGPCPYCSLPLEEWSKCASGFPGCARGDDAMLCPHVGASLSAETRIAELEAGLRKIADLPKTHVAFHRGEASFGLGWAFWNVQNIARALLSKSNQEGDDAS